MTILRVVDFETTGFPPSAGIVEIGWTDIAVTNPEVDGSSSRMIGVDGWQSEIVNPGMPIEYGAMGIHHIMEADVIGKRKPSEVLKEIMGGCDYFVAHNAQFEQEFFTPEKPWICTYKLALRLVPTAPNHKNQTLRYFLKTPIHREDAFPPHRAGPDSFVTAHTLRKFMMDLGEKLTFDMMVKWSSEPPLMPTCPIGKMRGKPWADVDMGFLMWCMRQPTMEADIKWNVDRELTRRRKNSS